MLQRGKEKARLHARRGEGDPFFSSSFLSFRWHVCTLVLTMRSSSMRSRRVVSFSAPGLFRPLPYFVPLILSPACTFGRCIRLCIGYAQASAHPPACARVFSLSPRRAVAGSREKRLFRHVRRIHTKIPLLCTGQRVRSPTISFELFNFSAIFRALAARLIAPVQGFSSGSRKFIARYADGV